VEHKNYIKAKNNYDGRFFDGTFEDVRANLMNTWNPEMYIVTLPDNSVKYGDDFIEDYRRICKEYDIEISKPFE
jgi:hypothetical protein